MASKDVILSAGALDTPKILLHSGIGPKHQLAQYGIPLIKDSSVGQGLRDHGFTNLVYLRAAGSTERKAFYSDEDAMNSALDQWKKDRTGDWTKFCCEMAIGYFKSDRIIDSDEFKDLPSRERAYMQQETVPHYEALTHFPIHWFIPDFPKEHLNYSCLTGFLYNAQARGEAVLQSSDPSIPLKFDPKFLSHPFDRRAAIETLRDLLKVAEHPNYAKDTVAPIAVPASSSDEDLLAYWRATMNSAWHMCGTVKMGKVDDTDAVVDTHFRVFGIEHLRVADMSVLPVLPSAHTQAPAYLTGATCAEILIEEYHLAKA
jgi:choline dehydrogenase-like flavoprotein